MRWNAHVIAKTSSAAARPRNSCRRSSIGTMVISRTIVRNDERGNRRADRRAAASTGVNLTYYKTLAFAVSAFFTGLAGSMLAHSTGFIAPENFDLFLSIKLLAMVVVVGLGSILGSVLGATLLTIVEQTLSR
ncbi:branched-chain amino acid ABC transporter permease [bacterium]|nr:branched-chain amino acid ABC transporter permease [bacterium]